MRDFLRLLCSAILAAAVAGCANTPTSKGIAWWPQGPGSTAEDVLATSDVEPPRAGHGSPASSTQPTNRDAHAVRYGDLLFVSGQVVADSAMGNAGSDIEAQVRNVMDSVMRILESHGLAISNIVSVTLYMRDDGLPNGSLVEIAVIAGK